MARHRLPKKKGPACTVCKHEHRALIEATRIAGASLDTISAKYGVSRDAVHRHMANHVDDDVRAEYLAAVPLKELAAKAAAEGLSVLEYLSLIRSTLVRQMQLASSVNDRNGVATVARTLNETLRQIGAITGDLHAFQCGVIRSVSVRLGANFICIGKIFIYQRHAGDGQSNLVFKLPTLAKGYNRHFFIYVGVELKVLGVLEGLGGDGLVNIIYRPTVANVVIVTFAGLDYGIAFFAFAKRHLIMETGTAAFDHFYS